MNYYNEIDPFAVGSLCYLAGLAEPVEVVWVVAGVAGVRVPWQRHPLVIATRYLRPAGCGGAPNRSRRRGASSPA